LFHSPFAALKGPVIIKAGAQRANRRADREFMGVTRIYHSVGEINVTHEDKGHFAAKHPPERKVDERVAEAVRKRASGGTLTCSAAFKIASELKCSPDEVGFTIDYLQISINKCQMGLYGYGPKKKAVQPAEEISAELETGIRDALVDDRLPCASAWKIADRLGLKKMDVSSACDAMGIKISSCQLGAF
jgi:hypothetical protein